MPIDIEDVEGLPEALAALTQNAGEMEYNGYNTSPAEVRLGGVLEKDLERLRFRIATLERKVELRHNQDTCIVCNRFVKRKHKSQPLLCEKHFIEWPKCPDCEASGWGGLTWTPKHAKANCKSCGKVFSGREMQFRIAAYWASEYEE